MSERETVTMVHAAAPVPIVTVPAAAPCQAVELKKHEAAGNDFLVLVDADSTWAPSAAFVRSVCDRRRGVGADGLLLARPGEHGADLEMVLYNADGSRAEMSGNGIRCLVQAAVMAGLAETGTLQVRTDAGVRVVEYEGEGGLGTATVEMGSVDLGEELECPLPGARAQKAAVGNPHVVVVVGAASGAPDALGTEDDLSAVDLEGLARQVTALVGEPVNVEVVRPSGAGTLALRVFERGVGETAACGTGSCAAVAVAHRLELVGEVVAVESPGGTLTVRLGSVPGGPALLRGPVRHVADVVLAPSVLDAGASP